MVSMIQAQEYPLRHEVVDRIRAIMDMNSMVALSAQS